MNQVMMNPGRLAKLMASENGIEQLMKQPVYENEYGYYSQAELLADVINILRMDAKRLGAMHDVDLDIQRMTPEKMAWMLSEMVDGNTEPLVGVFNDIEDYHHDVMEQRLDPAEFRTYLEFKEEQLFTVEPGNEKPDADDVAAELDDRLDDVEPDAPTPTPATAVTDDGGGEEHTEGDE